MSVSPGRVSTHRRACLAWAIAFTLAAQSATALASAQSTTATLTGRIIDESDAVVPDVEVVLIDVATGLERKAKTSGRGEFILTSLPPARYQLTAQRDGFTPLQVPDIVLNVNDQIGLSLKLKVANVGQSLTVTGEPSRINTSAALGTVLDRQFAENMPLNGRSFQSLITLAPGVVTVPCCGGNGGGQFSVNGQRTDANYFTVDGVSANIGNGVGLNVGQASSGSLPGLTALGTTQSLVSVDALQEFQVQTSGYAAEFGRQPGGQISVVTRSGTNSFHGSSYDYLRNDAFDANNWFSNRAGIKKQAERQNDFGGTFGGPIQIPGLYGGADRTFFFLSYEGLRLQVPQFFQFAYPSLALRQSAPSALQPLLNGFPLTSPNASDAGGGFSQYTSGYSNPSTSDTTSVRIDHSVNPRLLLFGRLNTSPSETDTRGSGNNLSVESFSAIDTMTFTVGATTTASPHVLNETRLNYSDNGGVRSYRQDTFGGAVPVPADLLLPSQYAPAGQPNSSLVGFRFPGGTVVDSAGLSRLSQRQVQVVDNISFSRDSHRFKSGVDYRRLTPTISPSAYQLQTTFLTPAQILNGAASSGFVFASKGGEPIYTNVSAYAQDTWSHDRLTVDLGVRWDLNPPPTEANGNAPFTASGLDNLATMTLAPQGTPLWRTTHKNFAPRFGTVYLLKRTPGYETVVKGGFGVFFDTGNNLGSTGFNNFPFSFNRSVPKVTFPLDPIQVAPPPFVVSPPYGTVHVFDPTLQLPQTLQWSVGVEQSLGPSQVFRLSYVGNAGRRLLQERNIGLNSINCCFTTVVLTTNNAASTYKAMQVQFQRRLSRGLQILASYTLSHAQDDDSVDTGTILPVRGNAAFDIRQVFSAAATYDVPALGQNALLNAVLAHLSMDANIHAQSAAPVDIIAAQVINPADGSVAGVRPNVVPGVPFYLDDPTVPCGRRINAAAFSVPPDGQFGTLGRNQLRGCPAWQVDAALVRAVPIHNGLKLQFRAEAFNVFNHPNFGSIDTTLTSKTFGQATNMLGTQLGGLNPLYQIGGPRSMQFALKFLF